MGSDRSQSCLTKAAPEGLAEEVTLSRDSSEIEVREREREREKGYQCSGRASARTLRLVCAPCLGGSEAWSGGQCG
jgi:hypothetical protein